MSTSNEIYELALFVAVIMSNFCQDRRTFDCGSKTHLSSIWAAFESKNEMTEMILFFKVKEKRRKQHQAIAFDKRIYQSNFKAWIRFPLWYQNDDNLTVSHQTHNPSAATFCLWKFVCYTFLFVKISFEWIFIWIQKLNRNPHSINFKWIHCFCVCETFKERNTQNLISLFRMLIKRFTLVAIASVVPWHSDRMLLLQLCV